MSCQAEKEVWRYLQPSGYNTLTWQTDILTPAVSKDRAYASRHTIKKKRRREQRHSTVSAYATYSESRQRPMHEFLRVIGHSIRLQMPSVTCNRHVGLLYTFGYDCHHRPIDVHLHGCNNWSLYTEKSRCIYLYVIYVDKFLAQCIRYDFWIKLLFDK